MKYFEEFRPGYSLDEPMTLSSAVEYAAEAYEVLEARVERALRDLVQQEHGLPDSLERYPLSQKAKTLGTLITSLRERKRSNVGDYDSDTLSAELVKLIEIADEAYRHTMKPDLLTLHASEIVLEPVPEDLTALLRYVGDYLIYAMTQLDDFMESDSVM